VLPARNRMTRSTEFGATVNRGVRAVQPDIVVHARRCADTNQDGPKVGLVVAKSVGGSVQRHRVARRLRHAARTVLDDLQPSDRIVIRARPSSRYAISAGLEQQLREALAKAQLLDGIRR
jgi:ribonuclease P protein component